jgi:hypothetical protein
MRCSLLSMQWQWPICWDYKRFRGGCGGDDRRTFHTGAWCGSAGASQSSKKKVNFEK